MNKLYETQLSSGIIYTQFQRRAVNRVRARFISSPPPSKFDNPLDSFRGPENSSLDYRGVQLSTQLSITSDTCRTPTNRRACVATHSVSPSFFVDLAAPRFDRLVLANAG